MLRTQRGVIQTKWTTPLLNFTDIARAMRPLPFRCGRAYYPLLVRKGAMAAQSPLRPGLPCACGLVRAHPGGRVSLVPSRVAPWDGVICPSMAVSDVCPTWEISDDRLWSGGV